MTRDENAPLETGAIAAGRDALLLSAERMAERLGVSKRTLWRLRSAGRLPRPVTLGRSIRWRADEVRQWIEAGCPPLSDWDLARGAGER